MAIININGNTIEIPDGASINICNNSVIVNGNSVASYNSNTPKIEITGNVGSLKCSGSATVSGNVEGNVDAGGSVTCNDVHGDVDAGGSVRCGNVSGDVDAGGSVHMSR